MDSSRGLNIYSIAAHLGFADALVAGLVPRYSDPLLGLAKVTLLLPSTRAARTLSEAFVRHSGETGLLMPRMVAIGDLELDEALGTLLDPLRASDIAPAVEPGRRWLELAELIAEERASESETPLPGAARLRMARDFGRVMDRLLVEEKTPADLISDPVIDQLGNVSEHYQKSIRIFARVQARWHARLAETGEVDAATRRNQLFNRAAKEWRADPPNAPIIAAGVTSAAPALAWLLRVIAGLPQGSVVLPDLDLNLSDEAWEELGRAGASDEVGGEAFGKRDAVTHPQYHLKLLLQRMGVARGEVSAWHRRGEGAAPPQRSKAISSLFLPPKASRIWVELEPEHRRMPGLKMLEVATSEEEAQAIALQVREALDVPEKRIAVVTADRSLARRVTQHLSRWNIQADDSAGRALSLTPAGRLFGLLAEIAADGLEPAKLIAALAHPLVMAEDGDARRAWLSSLRAFDHKLRGPAPAPGLEPLREIAGLADQAEWWGEVESLLAPLLDWPSELPLVDALNVCAETAEKLAGKAVWAKEDGRALSQMVDNMRQHARSVGTQIDASDIAFVLRDAMDEIAVRPPYGSHPRIAVYGLLESRMARADLVICGGLNEGSWPQIPGPDPVLAPAILRALGVPGAEFRIGLAAHDLAGAMGSKEVVLTRSLRDAEGPTLPSRFWMRVSALLGEKLAKDHALDEIPAILPQLDRTPPDNAPEYPIPAPMPSSKQRDVPIKVTALDRLLGDPYQFYASEILRLRRLDPLGADPFSDPALRGTLVHEVFDQWHRNGAGEGLVPFAKKLFAARNVHPLFRGLWEPRILEALERFEKWITDAKADGRVILATEIKGAMRFNDVKVMGRADRIDRMPDGSLAIVDYKTGSPPKLDQVKAGYALQLGLLGLIAQHGSFEGEEGELLSGETTVFEYWSSAKDKGEFGYIKTPVKTSSRSRGIDQTEFTPLHENKLAEAISRFIRGSDPFKARENPDYEGYSDYDQLMRLEEWAIRLFDSGEVTDG
ncbi:PD-(D/E)XK nuclease family protein [Erythrobacter sp. YT30]|uniref:PD-(D/E)XK nuclease family protein n=1 Tax=Erythrobacter sp. YT30 TaxID=1735012 RepID=UPI001F1996B5|nr:PD-(D/E)XK nuclease family protein [Erythrobacter sp. YT30]